MVVKRMLIKSITSHDSLELVQLLKQQHFVMYRGERHAHFTLGSKSKILQEVVYAVPHVKCQDGAGILECMVLDMERMFLESSS